VNACVRRDRQREEPLDRDTASERTYSSGDRGLRHELGMSDPVAQVTCRLSKGEALIVISFTSLGAIAEFW
jgi:hypothetical protein